MKKEKGSLSDTTEYNVGDNSPVYLTVVVGEGHCGGSSIIWDGNLIKEKDSENNSIAEEKDSEIYSIVDEKDVKIYCIGEVKDVKIYRVGKKKEGKTVYCIGKKKKNLQNKILDVTTKVKKVNPAKDKTSVSYIFKNGKKEKKITFENEANKDGYATYFVSFFFT